MRLTLIPAALLVAACVFCAEEPAAPRVEAIGVRVSKPSAAKESMYWPSGTTVLLQASSSVGEFNRLDALGSTLAKASDDAGTDLLPKIKGALAPGQVMGISPIFKIDETRKLCVVEVSTPFPPAPGAKSITVAGTLLMECASKKIETVLKNVPLRNGIKLAGPEKIELSIEQAGKPKYGDEPFGLLLRSERDLTNLSEVKFFKSDGTEFQAKRLGTSSTTMQGSTKVEWEYVFNENAESATVKLYTWSDATKKKIEFNLTVNLGL